MLVCPVTAIFPKPLNANCRTTVYSSQTPKKVDEREIKPPNEHLPFTIKSKITRTSCDIRTT